MTKKYLLNSLLLIAGCTLLVTSSCKKDNSTTTSKTTPTPPTATPASLGMYEYQFTDSIQDRVIFMVVPKIGTKTLSDAIDGFEFDTGSGGLVIDATQFLPASTVTTSGFSFTGDSTVIDSITITNQTKTIVYGTDASNKVTVYGNLAYANVVIGEPTDATITVKRLPFFVYYKATDAQGNVEPAGEFNILGVDPEYDLHFNSGANVGSPFESYTPGTGLTKGFKMSALGATNFTMADEIPLTKNVVTIGLTPDDISSSSSYKMNALTSESPYGYSPVITGSTIMYNGKSITDADVVFDSGTHPYNYIEDNTVTGTTLLANNTPVSAATGSNAFTYSYTATSTSYPTYIENPGASGGQPVSVFSLDYFVNNGFLVDYTNHKIGVRTY